MNIEYQDESLYFLKLVRQVTVKTIFYVKTDVEGRSLG